MKIQKFLFLFLLFSISGCFDKELDREELIYRAELESVQAELLFTQAELNIARAKVNLYEVNPPIPNVNILPKTIIGDTASLQSMLSRARSISISRTHLIYVNSDHKLMGLGGNEISQLGLSEETISTSKPITLLPNVKFTQVTTLRYGQPMTFALSSDGDVYGTGVVNDKPLYRWVKMATNVKEINSSRAIQHDGQLLDYEDGKYHLTPLTTAITFEGDSKIVGWDGYLYTPYTTGIKANSEDNLLPDLRSVN